MRIVADTNILFSFFWENSLIKQIILSSNMEIFSPEFAIEELEKHSSLIINKTKMPKKEFISELNKLKSTIKFFSKKDYTFFLKEASNISPDKDDAHFLALCLKLNLPLWSNDKELKKQYKIVVLNINDIIEVYFG